MGSFCLNPILFLRPAFPQVKTCLPARGPFTPAGRAMDIASLLSVFVFLWQKKSPICKDEAFKSAFAKAMADEVKDRQRLTLPGVILVPSALAGLTALFGMGRGDPRRYSHLKLIDDFPIGVIPAVPIAIGITLRS